MKRVRISIQIAVSLGLLSITALLTAHSLGLVPDERGAAVAARIAVCENLAVSSSILTSHQQWDAITVCLRELKARNSDVVSAGLRRQDGRLVARTDNHEQSWRDTPDERSTDATIYVPIFQGKSQWGRLEVAFQPINSSFFGGWINISLVRLVAFVAATNALIFVVYLGKVLYDLDPTRVMPQRVRSALDALTEGLLVLDNDGRIVMANQAFATALGRNPDSLLGKKAAELPWRGESSTATPPWVEVSQHNESRRGIEMSWEDATAAPRTFLVNAAPIMDGRGDARGVLASFADVTQLEQKKQELLKMLAVLKESRDKIRQQNDELAYLATRDPLTGCLNRRAFFEQFENTWRSPQVQIGELSCLMLDIDKFKSINDSFGHARGDEVLKRVASSLLTTIGEMGLVCRYGGEEFCVLLAGCPLPAATQAAESLRATVEGLSFPDLTVTVSLGVSCGSLGPRSCQELLDQADQSLYCSKRAGRNRVTRWDEVPEDFEVRKSDDSRSQLASAAELGQGEPLVPYHAVASLMSALAYRDPDTASHSARVADLAVATARGLMSAGDAYSLEIAALLHDIGKIGVPDSILLKPGPLTAEEWQIMHLHARIGVEIVNASFRSAHLVDIVRFHHALYGGDVSDPGLPKGKDIPLGARIVSIADAYDAMVSDRVYRKGRPQQAAFEELRRMSGHQFDPDLVERFIEVIGKRRPAPEMQGGISKDLALHLGLQTERLAQALDAQDLTTIRAMALHLQATAEKHGIESLKSAATLLQECVSDSDLPQMVQVIHQIIELSLMAQQAYLTIDHDMAQVAMARTQFIAGEPASPPNTHSLADHA